MENRLIPPSLIIFNDDVVQVSKDDAINLKKGDIVLVRSDYEYGLYKDHFSVIVGGKIQKERGLRPNLLTLPTRQRHDALFSKYTPTDGAIILKLSDRMAELVMKVYGIHLSEGELISI